MSSTPCWPDRTTRLRVAAVAGVDPRTCDAAFRGERIWHKNRAAIVEACRILGVTAPERVPS